MNGQIKSVKGKTLVVIAVHVTRFVEAWMTLLWPGRPLNTVNSLCDNTHTLDVKFVLRGTSLAMADSGRSADSHVRAVFPKILRRTRTRLSALLSRAS